MFEDFIKRHGIDIVLIQEITQPQIERITGYQTLLNIGSEMRGTGMMIKNGLNATDIQRLPTGRGIACTINGIQ
jgi:exonuclease III